ncbi:MAG TPA: alkaline phosphatase family protein [Nocardioides sp.]|nr:alkaline phosphatase family protein [Nocardioides sp.]
MTSSRSGGRPKHFAPALVLALTTALALALIGCTSDGSAASRTSSSAATQAAARVVNGRHVVAISVDGFNPAALTRLGRARTPYLHKLIYSQGAGTTNARSQVEMTVTLPNHTSMVTGRAIYRVNDGHGVTWNDDSVKKTVQEAAGQPVSSVFEQVHAAGGTTGVFATKSKFWLFERSWPEAVDRNVIKVEDNAAVVRKLRADLVRHRRSFSFLHLGLPDQMGHEYGWMSPKYLRAIERVDALVGSVMRTIRGHRALDRSTVVVLTADHGGLPGAKDHSDATRWQNFRIPFAIWGRGVPSTGLYALNANRAKPGKRRIGFTGVQPIRNGEVANLSLSLLGLGPVPGSRWDAAQDLRWR